MDKDLANIIGRLGSEYGSQALGAGLARGGQAGNIVVGGLFAMADNVHCWMSGSNGSRKAEDRGNLHDDFGGAGVLKRRVTALEVGERKV